jgi:hypothetical protein
MKATSHTRFISNKKAVVEFVFSKLAFLIFGIIITATFFYFLGVQKDIQTFDEGVKSAESIVNVVSTVSASPFNVTIKYHTGLDGNLSVANNSIILVENNREIKYSVPLPINDSTSIASGCLYISKKANLVVISACQ